MQMSWDWWQPSEGNYWNRSKQHYSKGCRRINVDYSTVIQNFYQKTENQKVQQMSAAGTEQKKYSVMKSVLHFFCKTKSSHILIAFFMTWWEINYIWQHSMQWFNWGEALKHFPKAKLHQKVLFTVWWLANEIIPLQFGRTITAKKYCQEIDKIHQKLQHLCPILANWKGKIFLHDNAKPHFLQMALQKLNELGYENTSSDLSLIN